MTLQEHLSQAERQFEQKSTERDQHTEAANECLTEMVKLQGEVRLLNQLISEETASSNDPATSDVSEA